MRTESGKRKHNNRLRGALPLITAALVFCLAGLSVFAHDRARQKEQILQTEPAEAVGFLCGSRDGTEAVGITGDPYEDYWDVYLPGRIEEGVRLVCDRAFRVRIGDQTYRNGDLFPIHDAGEEVPAVIVSRYDTECSGVFRFYEVYDLPDVFLSMTEDGAEEAMEETKGQNESAACMIADTDGSISVNRMCSMRVHGNTTWFENKKSYNLHFTDPVSPIGMSAQKKWVLLGNQTDNSSLENAIMQTLASRMGEKFCPEWRYVNVFLNGEYKGLYLLIQKIDISGGTIHIADLEEENSQLKEGENPDNITGGYQMELMGELSWDIAPRKYETPNRYIEVKSPKNATAEEINYISDLTNRAEEKLYQTGQKQPVQVGEDSSQADRPASEEGSGAGNDSWLDDYDEKSWIIQFLLQEISSNCDTELGSQFFYVDQDDSHLYGGPAWDFDKSLWLPTGNESLTYTVRSLHVDALHDDGKVKDGKLWLQQMDSDPVFHRDMKQFYLETAEPVLSVILAEDVPEWRAGIQPSVLADCIRWNKDYEGTLAMQDRVTEGFTRRAEFLKQFYQNEDAWVIVRFRIEDGRYDLLVPVLKGDAIHEEVMPLVDGSMEWIQEDGSPFTADTPVESDMTVTVVPVNEEEGGQ